SGGSDIAATASSSMNNAFAAPLVLDARTLLNRSPGAYWQVADVKFQNAATFDNRGTVLLDNFGIEPDNAAPSKIANSGTLKVSGLGGSFWVPVVNGASGVVEVMAGNGTVFYRAFDNAGTLSVTGGGLSTAFYG